MSDKPLLELKDMTYHQMIELVTWEVMRYVLMGKLQDGVEQAIRLYALWEDAQQKKKGKKNA